MMRRSTSRNISGHDQTSTAMVKMERVGFMREACGSTVTFG
jgi:hypothetical protein